MERTFCPHDLFYIQNLKKNSFLFFENAKENASTKNPLASQKNCLLGTSCVSEGIRPTEGFLASLNGKEKPTRKQINPLKDQIFRASGFRAPR